MKNHYLSAILVAVLGFQASASMAASATKPLHFESSENNKGMLVVVTERGQGAKFAAHILSAQLVQHPAYMPAFLALEGPALQDALDKYGLTRASLPAYIFIDRKGHEVGRIAGEMPTAARLVANNWQLN